MEFINKIWFYEVTAQDQGIEMYEMLVTSMNIQRDVDVLDKAIEELHNYSSLKSSDETNSNIEILSTAGIVLSITSLLIAVITYYVNYIGVDKLVRVLSVSMLKMLNVSMFKMLFAILFAAAPVIIFVLIRLFRRKIIKKISF